MTPEQQRKILEAAAKACGFKKWRVLTSGLFQVSNNENWNEAFAKWTGWNPLTNPADCAEMCSKLKISTIFQDVEPIVACHVPWGACAVETYATEAEREAAWRLAATTVAAKVGGYTDEP